MKYCLAQLMVTVAPADSRIDVFQRLLRPGARPSFVVGDAYALCSVQQVANSIAGNHHLHLELRVIAQLEQADGLNAGTLFELRSGPIAVAKGVVDSVKDIQEVDL